MYEEQAIIGFMDLGLKCGDEIEIEKGVVLHAVPRKVIVVKEYPDHICIKMGFRRAACDRDKGLRYITTGLNKGAMLCGDILVRRKGEDTFLTDKKVGISGYVKNAEVT